jgi:type II secretory ATPase GspE/PulE/Tfp pilus assembly ATPase PilB-like protein
MTPVVERAPTRAAPSATAAHVSRPTGSAMTLPAGSRGSCRLTSAACASVVMSDYYVESADRLMRLEGSAGDPAGAVTVQMAKSHCSQNPVIEIDGYRGRIAIHELMMMDDEVRGLVMKNADASTIRRACTAKGMKLLRQDGVERVLAGQTTIEELLRVTQEDIL